MRREKMTAPNKNNNLAPIDRLKEDKRRLKTVCQEDAKRLQDNWNYMSDHLPILFVNTALNSAKIVMGNRKKKEKEKSPFGFLSSLGSGPSISMLGIMNTALPILWDIAQPMLVGLAFRKIKGLFSSKKKKKKKN